MKTNNHVKAFAKVEQSSASTLSHFETTIQKLRSDNEELAILHANVDQEIESLTNLKENISVRVANNQSAINGLERVIKGV